MSRNHLVLAAVLAGLAASPAAAQAEGKDTPTAEQLIEVARERHRPPGVRRSCPQGQPGEIVVCATNPGEYRVPSSLDDAIEQGVTVGDGVPRAPDVFGLPPCNGGCMRIGRAPPTIYLIDLSAIPEPLTPEEAANVFRAEDAPAQEP